MFDFNSLPENAQRLIDEAALLHWQGRSWEAKLNKLEREHKRATKEAVDMTRMAAASSAKGKGIEKALISMFSISKRDMWREIDRRAIELYGAYPTA